MRSLAIDTRPLRESRDCRVLWCGRAISYLGNMVTFVLDTNAMVFGMPQALFPAVAISHFDRGAGAVGLLYAAPAVGALGAVAILAAIPSLVRYDAKGRVPSGPVTGTVPGTDA